MRFVVDSSVVTKAFAREKGSGTTLALLNAAGAGRCQLIAPSILIYEVTIALVRKGFRSRLLHRKLERFLELTTNGIITLINPDAALLKESASIAEKVSPNPRTKPWLNDAVFHALAQREAATLVTADRAYVERLKLLPKLQAGVVLYDKLSLPSPP